MNKKDINICPSNFIKDEEFHLAVVDCLSKNNLTVSQLAVKIQMSVTTIERWINKETYPLMIMRKSVITALDRINNENKV